MAYINLLPPEERRVKWDRKHFIFLLIGIIYVILIFYNYMSLQQEFQQAQNTVTSLEDQITVLKDNLEKAKEEQKNGQQIQEKTEQLRALIQESNTIDILLAVSKNIPEELVLSRMNVTVEMVTFEGEAASYNTISKFIEDLDATTLFQRVEVISSFATRTGGNKVGFKITAILNA